MILFNFPEILRRTSGHENSTRPFALVSGFECRTSANSEIRYIFLPFPMIHRTRRDFENVHALSFSVNTPLITMLYCLLKPREKEIH